eukprot:3252252-Rhodomonas_salina.1
MTLQDTRMEQTSLTFHPPKLSSPHNHSLLHHQVADSAVCFEPPPCTRSQCRLVNATGTSARAPLGLMGLLVAQHPALHAPSQSMVNPCCHPSSRS